MTDKELRRLSRAELLELLLEQTKELDEVKGRLETANKELEEARAALKKREIDIDEAGSIAVAALKVNGIFEVAQAASQQYIENIKRLSERQDKVIAKRDSESKARAEKLLADTRRKCAAMEIDAKRRSEAYWAEVSTRLKTFYDDHQEIKRLLDLTTEK